MINVAMKIRDAEAGKALLLENGIHPEMISVTERGQLTVKRFTVTPKDDQGGFIQEEGIYYVTYENGKFENYSIVGSSRKVKAKTFLEKYEEKLSEVSREWRVRQKQQVTFGEMFEHYQKVFPNAKFTPSFVNSLTRDGRVFRLNIEFENGRSALLQVNKWSQILIKEINDGLDITQKLIQLESIRDKQS